jgi:hypothetical protein
VFGRPGHRPGTSTGATGRLKEQSLRDMRGVARAIVGGGAVEFLVDMVTTVPAGTSEDEVADMRGREAARAAELARRGWLLQEITARLPGR